MDNIIFTFDEIGEAGMDIVDDESYDILFKLYESQQPGHQGYDEMIEEFWGVFAELNEKKNFKHILLQWNSHDHLEEPITFKRILQVM